jgi:LDH2 family malate/lactate/ureidoglycolate dehydrogenase
MIIAVADLHRFCVEALLKAGASDAHARTTADVLVTTDTWGTFTHGTKALRAYIRRLRAGGLRPNGNPHIIREGPAWALVDGDSSLGMVSSVFAMNTAIAKAKNSGIAFVGLRNNCHYGAAGYYASMAIPENMIGFSMANDIPTVGAPGAKGHILGSNPYAFAAPAGKELPIMLDMATSIVAGGKVFAAAALGKPIPDGWIQDLEAKPTRDATLFSHAATLNALGGYKGFCIAFMIEVLSAVLTGSSISRQVMSWTFGDLTQPTGHGAAFMAINIGTFIDIENFKQRMDHLIQEIHSAPKADTGELFAPGEIEFKRREKALQDGIDLPADVVANLQGLADDLGMKLPTPKNS